MKKIFSHSSLWVLAVLIVGIAMLIGSGRFQKAPELFDCNSQQMTEAQVAQFRGIAPETMQLLHTRRGLTTPEICVMPQAKLDRAVNRVLHPMPDHPGEWLEFRKLQQQDENGLIPSDGLVKAAQKIDAMAALQHEGGRESITSNAWVALGPGNIGGRVRSIVIHPTNTNILWAGSVAGGIWKSTDGGASWNILDDFLGNMAVSTLILDLANPNILYAGTGEGFYNGDGLQGAGIFKTLDGGTTWTQLASTSDWNWYYVNRLAISSNSSTILAATGTGIWRSTNGGVSWTQTLFERATYVAIDPTNINKAVASSSEGKAWYSTTGGASWTPATGLPALDWLGRVELAYAPSNTNIVYASVAQNSGEVWKSTNGGASYTLVNTGNNYLGGQGWYDNTVWVDPTDANTLVVGGIDLWRSTNGGVTLTKISQWWSAPDSAHADNHAIVQDPGFNGTTNTRVYIGNDGGVYRADNIYTVLGTNGWTELNNNLGITQFYGAAGNPSTGEIIGGTQDNGTLFYTAVGGAEGWTTTYGGDGGWSAADPSDPDYFYGEYINLQIFRSANRGVSGDDIFGRSWHWNGSAWEEIWKDPPYRIDDAMTGSANFIAPFILDPNNPNRLLGGGLSLWRTDDVKTPNTDTTGPSWYAIKSSIGDNISAIAVAPGNSNIIWVGHNDGSVYKTLNGTAATPTWIQVDNNTPVLPNRYVTRITIDANNNNIVYVTFGGFSSNNVWRTANSGTNWADVTGSGGTGLPDLPIRSLVIHPNNSNWLYVGSELGIFTSEDGGANWAVPHNGPTNTSVDELFWMDTTLVAASHGRGLFKVNTLGLTCYTLTLTHTGSGGDPTTIPASSNGCSNGQYQAGEIVTLVADPDLDWAVGSWNGTNDNTSTLNTNAVTMPAGNASATANYIYSPAAPSAPINLSVSSTAWNSVTLSWQDTSYNEEGFNIYRWGYDGSQWTFIYLDSVGANTLEYTDTNLECTSSYYYEVSAYNAIGESAHADWVQGDTTICPPASFSKSSPGNDATNQLTSLTLVWGTSAGAASYEYCYDATNDNACSNWTDNGTAVSKALNGLATGTTYYWHVRAINESGATYSNGSSTAFWSFTTGTVPGTFNKSDPPNGAIDQPTNATLSWGTSAGATSYQYCYDTSNDNACSNWISNDAFTAKTLSGLSQSTTYYWHVRAVNGIGTTYSNGSNTSFWSFTTNTPPVVSTILRADTNPTNALNVDFTVTFSEAVMGVSSSDFVLTTTGVTGASITAVSGSGATYTISVNTGSGNGTLRLDVPNSATITDLIGNPLSGLPYTSGEVYDILFKTWSGGLSISADQNVIPVGRPEIGAQKMTYNGFNGGSTTAYIPMLFKDAFGGSYDAALYIQNLHPSNDANITIQYYDTSGNLTHTVNDTIARLSSKGYWLPGISQLGSSWVGAAVITSDTDIVAVGRPHIGGEILTYNGFASGSTTMYVPMLFKDAFGGSYDAALYVQNLHPSSTANITIQYYDTAGNLTYTTTDTLARLSSKGYWLPGIPQLGSAWVGAAVIISDTDIVAVGRPHIGTQIMTYDGFASGLTNAYVPMLYKDINAGSYDSALYIQNVHPSNTANIALKFYDTNGNLTCTVNDTIARLSSKGYWLPGTPCLGPSWQGSVQVESDLGVVAVGRPHLGSEIMTYDGAEAGSLLSYLPMLFRDAFGGSYDATVYFLNTDSTNPSNLTLQFYDTTGNLSCTKTTLIQANGTINYFLPDVICDP